MTKRIKYIILGTIAIYALSCREPGSFVVVDRAQPYQLTRQVRCKKFDYCWTCKYLIDCKMDWSDQCSGEKTVFIEVEKQIGYYQNEPAETVIKQKVRTIKQLTECQ